MGNERALVGRSAGAGPPWSLAHLEDGVAAGGAVELDFAIHPSPAVTVLAARFVVGRLVAAAAERAVVRFTTPPSERLLTALPPPPVAELGAFGPVVLRVGDRQGQPRYLSATGTLVVGGRALDDGTLAAVLIAGHRHFAPGHCPADDALEGWASGPPAPAPARFHEALLAHERALLGER